MSSSSEISFSLFMYVKRISLFQEVLPWLIPEESQRFVITCVGGQNANSYVCLKLCDQT